MGRDAFTTEEAEEHYDKILYREPGGHGGSRCGYRAIVQKVAPKKEGFAALEDVLPPEATLLASISSIFIAELTSATGRVDKV